MSADGCAYEDRLRALADMPEPPAPPSREFYVEALAAAAVILRDAEFAVKAARESYGRALQAFNRHVAPVPTDP